MSQNELQGLLVRTHDDTRRFKFIRVSSRDRTNGTASNFQVSLGNESRFDKIVEVHLLSAIVPNVANNISAAIGNNSLAIDFTIAGNLAFPIPDGFYSVNSWINYIVPLINAAITPSTILITQAPNTNLLTFTITGAETMIIQNLAGGSTLSPTLGFTTVSAAAGTLTADTIPNFAGATVFYLHSADLGNNLTYLPSQNNGASNSVNGLFTIPVSVPFGSSQTYVASDQDRIVYGANGYPARYFQLTWRTNQGRLYSELPDNMEAIAVFKVIWSSEMA